MVTTMTGASAFGRMCRNSDPPGVRAQRPRGHHVVVVLVGDDLAAHDPEDLRPAEDRHDERHRPHVAAAQIDMISRPPMMSGRAEEHLGDPGEKRVSQPPRRPASMPSRPPMSVVTTVVTTPTTIELRVP